MNNTISCTGCGRFLQLPGEHIGRAVQCPACGHVQVAGWEANTPLQIGAVLGEKIQDVLPPDVPAPLPAVPRRPDAEPPAWYETFECPSCLGAVLLYADRCPHCNLPMNAETVRAAHDKLVADRDRWYTFSFLFGVAGLAIQVTGYFPLRNGGLASQEIGFAFICFGIGLLCLGIAFAARYKGHSMAFGLLGIVSFPGILLLAIVLRDRNARRLYELEEAVRCHEQAARRLFGESF